MFKKYLLNESISCMKQCWTESSLNYCPFTVHLTYILNPLPHAITVPGAGGTARNNIDMDLAFMALTV